MNRRNKKDRRSRGRTKPFPLSDSSGQWVASDRRVLRGRRKNSIEGAWQELEALCDLTAMTQSSGRQDG